MDDDSDSERTIIDDDSDYERTIIDDDSDSQKSIIDEEYRIDENKYRVMLIEHLSKRKKMAASSASNARRRIETPLVSQDRVSCELLEMGSGIVLKIPPTYDALAQSLNFPTLSDVKIDASVDLTSSNFRLASERRARNQNVGYSMTYPSLQDRLSQSFRYSNSIPFNLQVGDSDDTEITAMQAFVSDHVEAPQMQIVPVTENPLVLERFAMPSTQYVRLTENSSVLERFATQHVPVTRNPSALERSTMPVTQQYSSDMQAFQYSSGMQAFHESYHFEVPTMQHVRVTQNPWVLERPAMPITQQFISGMQAFVSDNVEVPLMQHLSVTINPPVFEKPRGIQVIESFRRTEHQLTTMLQNRSQDGSLIQDPDKITVESSWKKIVISSES